VTTAAWLILLLIFFFVLSSIFVLAAKKLVVIISAIGLGSVILAIIFFMLKAPYAGAFELSVGAGLISILFIIATSVADQAMDETE
jgi:uncharacterized MnhB-related membrane protein